MSGSEKIIIYVANFLGINSQNVMDSFLCENKAQLVLSWQMRHKSKTKKRQVISRKKDYSVRHFISVLSTAR